MLYNQLNTLHLDKKKIAKLLKKGICKVVTTVDIPNNVRTFNSSFVDERKNASTNKPYKKSQLVVQVYNNQEKDLVQTQSPKIEQMS